jgi:phosphopantetheinyl transferase (holo-ACP synthase)
MKITHEVQISDSKDAFTNSREALSTILNRNGYEVLDLSADLELVNYHNLKKFPDLLVSLSHTKGAGAAVVASKEYYVSLGIDIEWCARVMKKEAERFFRNSQDSIYENNLELWTMKEAAFKALSPLGFPGVLVLSKIIIQNGRFWTDELPERKGEVTTSVKSFDNKKLCVSIALITSD